MRITKKHVENGRAFCAHKKIKATVMSIIEFTTSHQVGVTTEGYLVNTAVCSCAKTINNACNDHSHEQSRFGFKSRAMAITLILSSGVISHD